jgi:hypothetical protein
MYHQGTITGTTNGYPSFRLRLLVRERLPQPAAAASLQIFHALKVWPCLCRPAVRSIGTEEAKRKGILKKADRGAAFRQVGLLTSPFMLKALT